MDTLFLATVIGWYFVITSLFILVRHDYVISIAKDLMKQPGLLMVVAIFTLILGLLMVTNHNIWVMGWPVVVTIISWMVLISGVIRLFFAEAAIKFGQFFIEQPINMRASAVFSLLIGLFLLYHAYATYFEFLR